MKKLLTLLKKISWFKLSEEWILLIAYFGLLFCLAFGFDILYTIWKALIGQYIYIYMNTSTTKAKELVIYTYMFK